MEIKRFQSHWAVRAQCARFLNFNDVPGRVTVRRNSEVLWTQEIWSGEKNMSHSVRNLEHHHFKYEAHRRLSDVHIHFFGADAFSFGDGITLEDGDVMEVSFPAFGRALRNPIAISTNAESLVSVRTI